MHQAFIDPHSLELSLRALEMVAVADGRLQRREREFLEVLAETQRGSSTAPIDVDALAPLEPAALGAAVHDEHARTCIVRGQIIMALMDGDVVDSECETVQRFALALGVDEPRLRNLRQLARRQYRALKAELNNSNAMVNAATRYTMRVEGPVGVWKIFGPFVSSKLALDSNLAHRYQQLGLLPEHTLGRAYWEYMRKRGYPFPGEPRGYPEVMMTHDVSHVLADYDTDPAGECEVVAFIGGFMQSDPFGYMFMISTHMHLGVEVYRNTKLGKGGFEPARVIAAYQRGTAVREDLFRPGFDWWAYLERPLEEVRAELNILPKVPLHASANVGDAARAAG